MKSSSHIFIVASILLTANIYACDDNSSSGDVILSEDSIDRCSDGIDNDDNGKIDCNDEQCKQFDHCRSPVNPVPENTEELCNDGIDNDNNQKTDCQDESCKQFDHCKSPVNPVPENTEELCNDGIDNDNNQKTDCQEESCKQFDHCKIPDNSVKEDTKELCSDGIDNDNNGKADCLEGACQAFDFCKDENGNHLKDSFEPGFESSEKCNKHSKCSSGFCDSFIGKCSVKCTSDEQCMTGFYCRQDGRCSAEAFETLWKTEEPQTQINFMSPKDTVGECDFVIDWGDGSEKETWKSCPTTEKLLVHTYANPGEYHVKVTGKMTHWMPTNYQNVDYTSMIYQIISYGPVGIAAEAFKSYLELANTKRFINLNSLAAIDIPDPTYLGMNKNNERTLANMFENSRTIQHGVGNWDVSHITSLSKTFYKSGINDDLERWDTSSVTNMQSTFEEAIFHGNISTWDTSKVTTMVDMFNYYHFFNSDIGSWDTSNVESMAGMFSGAWNFNKNIGRWNVSKVKSMEHMFFSAKEFNQDLNQWDVSNVENFGGMFGMTSLSIAPKSWNVQPTASVDGMFFMTNISCDDINEIRTNWNRSEPPSRFQDKCTP